MSTAASERIMAVFSIIERGRGSALMDMLNGRDIRLHLQCVGSGTAPSEMMDILGLGSSDKDIVISFAKRRAVEGLAAELGKNLGTGSGFGGLMMVLAPSAIGRLTAELIARGTAESTGKGVENALTSEYKHSLIVISVNQGYTDEVMHTAKQAGATGGTVIRARLSGTELLDAADESGAQEEKELVVILAPESIRDRIMEDVNREFGLRTEAKGIVCALPVEKAFKL